MSARYAIYFVPSEETALGAFGARWFHGDESFGDGLEPATRRPLTQKARRYGFHATLKAPFHLIEDANPAALSSSLAGFTAQRPIATAPSLVLQPLSGFLAMVPSALAPELEALAQACVELFEPYRASPSDAELARRRAVGLTPRQESNLRRWGYPYVAEDFRFHMTLTDRLAQPELRSIAAALQPFVTPFARQPLVIESLALVRQETADRVFEMVERFPLARVD